MCTKGGRARFLYPNPTVTVGLTLTVEPSTVLATSTDPIHLVLTARILKTPQPTLPVTFCTEATPFDGLRSDSFTNIVSFSPSDPPPPEVHPRLPGLILPLTPGYRAHHKRPDSTGPPTWLVPDGVKFIELAPYWRARKCSPGPNLASLWEFFTIPPAGEGVLIHKYEVPRDMAAQAYFQPGDHFRVSMTDGYLGTNWWNFGDLEGKRPRSWAAPNCRENREEDENRYGWAPEWADELRRSDAEAGVWEYGEDPRQFMFVIENEGRAGVAGFEVVGDEISMDWVEIFVPAEG